MSKDKNPRRVADNEAMAVSRMLRTSPQKLNLVAQMIRNKPVEKALADLTFSKKRVSEHVKKTLQSAIANASQKDGLGGDVERLYVSACYANNGPSQKRVRPAPMGRAFRVVKRTTHLTVAVSERPVKVAPVSGGTPAKAKAARPKTRAKQADKE